MLITMNPMQHTTNNTSVTIIHARIHLGNSRNSMIVPALGLTIPRATAAIVWLPVSLSRTPF